ncbi:MAG: PBP1A family penicillin-binding protein [Desulfobacterales bacterium]|jgi:penicillin-binding protein 1B|nr:PBP1A family penicillin-binding protein [Desulfobacterales bacterium]
MKKKKTVYKHIRSWVLQLILVALLSASAAGILYITTLAGKIDTRFAGRLWDLPSKVYSDTTLLYTGQTISHRLFREKLDRLGYRQVDRPPEKAGEMRFSNTAIEIYLRPFQAPYFEQKSGPVWIGLKGNRISDIISGDAGSKTPVLELEPEELMLYFGPDRERRELVSIRNLPPHVLHAVLAAEDYRFYHHRGIEIKAILRALATNLRKGEISQGGSTITQQLAKNYFLSPERTLSRKLKELLITGILEYKFDKDTILEMYLNEIYFGQEGSVSINGIGQAAQFYFDKPAAALSVAEAATIAGLIKAPNRYSPYKNRTQCKQRRNDVIDAMHKRQWLTAEAHEGEKARPVTPAGYRDYHQQAPYFMDYLTQQLSTLYSRKDLSREGLSIFTTIDTQVQSAAEKALNAGLARLESINPKLKRKNPEGKLQGAVIVMQPKTGYIIAMVGGRDYGISQFNRAAQAKRQPGSAIKPFVYLTGLDRYRPPSRLSNEPRTYMINGRPWRPKNYNPLASPVVTFREALAFSHNIATVNLALDIGLTHIAKTFRSFYLPAPETPYAAMALGALELDPLSLARAYCVFAADGVLPYPLSIKEVAGEDGHILENRHATIERLIPATKAYMINNLLRSVVLDGTARGAKRLGVNWPVAGKTGTTNDSRDAWFIGYTPNLLAVVWVGFDNGDSIMASGASAALPIWADLMLSLPQYVSGEWFTMPSGIETIEVCSETGMLPNPGCCPGVTREIFLSVNRPTTQCRQHDCPTRLEKIWKGFKDIVPGF